MAKGNGNTKPIKGHKMTQDEKKMLENDFLILNREVSSIRERGLSTANFLEQTKNLNKKLIKADLMAAKAYDNTTSKCIALDSELLHNISCFNPQFSDMLETDTQIFNPIEFADKVVSMINPASALAAEEDERNRETGNVRFAASQGRSQRSQRLRGQAQQRKAESKRFSVEELRAFGRKYALLNNESPTFDFLLGSFELSSLEKQANVEKVRRQRVKHNFDTTDRQKPKDYEDDQVKDVVTEQVENFYKHVCDVYHQNDDKPVPFFSTVLDRDSFSRTVTNLFHSSFLIKDGSIGINRDEDGLEVLHPLRDTEEFDKGPNAFSGDRPRKQGVLSFNQQDWMKWIEQSQQNQLT